MMLKQPHYYGLKTGVTEAAGPCLSAYWEKDGQGYVIVLLGAKSMEARWSEVPTLIAWALQRQPSILESYMPPSFRRKD